MKRIFVVAAVALTACTQPAAPPKKAAEPPAAAAAEEPLQPPAQWMCEDGREMTVAFFGDRVDIVFADERKLSLPAVVAASGEAYEANGVRFHAKGGEEAYIEEGDKVTNCKLATETE